MLRSLTRLLPAALGLAVVLGPLSSRAASSSWQVFAPVRTSPILYEPSGIALDPAGHLYISDGATGTVHKLSDSTRPLAEWSSSGASKAALVRPTGIVRGKNGDLFVANPGNREVVELTSSGSLVRSWPVPGLSSTTYSVTTGAGTNSSLTVTLNSQLAIAVGPGGNVLTLQPSGKARFTLRRFSSTGTLQRSYPIEIHIRLNTSFPNMQGLEYISTPLGIAVSADGTQFLTLEEQVCSVSRNNRCRAYQILQKRSAAGGYRGEWQVAQNEVGPQQTTGLALTRAGQPLVPAPQANAIYTYSVSGERLRAWKRAPGPGDFSHIGGIAVSPSGNIFVVGTLDRAVQQLSPRGSRLAIWGEKQSDIFSYPKRLAVDGAGNVYLTVTGHLKKLLPNGATAATWKVPNGPNDVAIGPKGSVYVTLAGGVRQFSPGGAVLRTWGSRGHGPGQFRGAAGIAVDAAGHVYVADTFNHRIQEFTSTGTFVKQWGSRGPGEGQFEDPVDVTISPSGNIYVADDSGNGRLEEFSADGTFVAQYRVPLAPWDPTVTGNYPTSVAVDTAGEIFTTYGGDAVVEIVPGGTPRFWGGPGLAPGQFLNTGAVALDRAGALYVTDVDPTYLRHDRIQKLHIAP